MKRITAILFAACVAGIGVSAAAANPQHAKTLKTVTITMRDPGCHWFLVGGKLQKTLTVTGPVWLSNHDEAALKLQTVGISPLFGARFDRVGALARLDPGTYRITMVGQAPDDNHLVLYVK